MSEGLLSASGEAAWQSLRQHIDWTEGFWIGWVFTDHTPSVHELHSRIAGQLRAVGRGSEIEQPREPGELAAVLRGLLAGADGCDGCVTVAVVRQEEAWQEAWDQFLLRLNERRELLREQLRGGLLLCAPTRFKARSREAAPDLWSIRSLALDVAPVVSSRREPMITRREDMQDDTPGSPAAVTLALQAVAAAQRAGQPDAETSARIRAAEALFAVGRRDEGREQAVHAVEAAPTPVHRVRALLLLADIERRLGDVVAAERHYRAAIAVDPVMSGTQAYGCLAELLLRRGALVEARTAAERSLALSRVQYAPSAEGEQAKGEAASCQLLGDVLRAQGDWSGAGAMYEEALVLIRRSRRTVGDTAELLRDEAAILQRIGDVLGERGIWSGARAVYEDALRLSRWVRRAVGDTADVLRNEVLSLVRIGEVSRVQGDLSAAMVAHTEGLGLSRKIRGLVGDTPEALEYEASGLVRIGDVLWAQGDLSGARAAFEEGLALGRRIRGIAGDTAVVMQDISVNLERLGDLLRAQDDGVGAEDAFDESLRLRRRVRGMLGDTAVSLRAVAVSLERLGAVLRDKGDLSGAVAAYEEALELSRRIRGLPGDTDQAVIDLAVDLLHCAEVHEEQGKLAEAHGVLLEAIELLRGLAAGVESPEVTAMMAEILKGLARVSREEAAPARLADSKSAPGVIS